MKAPTCVGNERTASPAPKRVSLIQLAILLAVVLALVVWVLSPEVYRAPPAANDDAARAALSDLKRALEAYAADFGTYPSRPGFALVADTTFYVDCLKRPGPKGFLYYNFKEDDLEDGKYLGPMRDPYYYSFPLAGIPAPDGRVHEGVGYYLWTRGCVDQGPGAAWAINNWSR